ASIKSCLGCFACWNKTPGTCVINDDMSEILKKMIAADVIIWSFPLYYFSVPGGLKNLIDRQLPLNLPFMAEGKESGSHPARYDLTNQKHLVISTCGFCRSKGNYDGVISMFDHACGKGSYSAILCGQGELFRLPELKSRTDA
ncbi:MAG TPA: NAD(P)H dehydrogenase, partial [Clostridium sp.]|nr:NAD(P)H dehydrogenase [Clostridium sp.]